MKQSISAPKLGLTFTGCFLGAGYVSGRETWQFFGRFGPWGWAGLILAMLILGIFGAMILRLARRTGLSQLSQLVIPWRSPFLRQAVSVFAMVFLMGVVTIMTAGMGALFEQMWGLPPWACSLFFSAAVAGVALAGLGGMVSAFSLMVPVLTAATVCFSIAALFLLPPSPLPAGQAGGNWLASSVTFAAYNIFTTIAILAPLGRDTEKGVVYRGIPIGSALLAVVAAAIVAALHHCAAATALQLPMLEVVAQLSPIFSCLYALLLLMAMFGTAMSCFLTVVNSLAGYLPPLRRHRVAGTFLAVSLTWCASLLGFGELINLFYPIFGCLSALFLICLAVHFAKVVRAQRLEQRSEPPTGEKAST